MNLIICMTPFQMLMAEKIVEKKQSEIFYLLVFYSVWNDKYQYYMEKVLCKKNVFFLKKCFISPNNHFSRLYKSFLVRIYGFLLCKKFNKVYIANLDNPWIRLLLSSLGKFELYTFDDGTANIFKNSFFYKNDSFRVNLIMKLLFSRYTRHDLRKMSLVHYTIYDNKENIVDKDKLVYVSMREGIVKISPHEVTSSKERVNLLLGQPIDSIFISVNDGVSVVKKIIEVFDINYYYPHPRERFIIDGVNYIKSKLIFEDYFVSQFRLNVEYTIYTFYSGAPLSFINLPNVKIISIKPDICRNEIVQDFEIMKSFGVEVIDYTCQ
ncbi:CMP-N-acetylneuraminate-beta-galactosamide-alpha-2, 3-sialyltransferase [Glaesserella parasuis]|uniref:glycosyltransferase family 52 n=2 Tax=Glaesserella parasuis TaxID=738 RepID=UPI001325BA91|nr:glycosyltransferase family 52 [Glaesserella parasuis]MDO9647958.1 glycosyltransferase family 52 [Glaesserella parasuis]MWQ24122.1 CMP-N-acetylneuraminate-beta-galactosamide-alpha-2, 3-sialyltransferase [Glaesserella parasuis]MWQ40292.1 CMP-N-acetylneuraminate-beta-galactosamide-alpha-2, 3-sialyltransferase [Glaesserella parasuis]